MHTGMTLLATCAASGSGQCPACLAIAWITAAGRSLLFRGDPCNARCVADGRGALATCQLRETAGDGQARLLSRAPGNICLASPADKFQLDALVAGMLRGYPT